VTLPDSLTKLGKRAFIDCVGLNGNLVMPNGLSEISESAFAYPNIKSIKFGKVKTIGKWAFYGCNRLTTLTIPGTVKNIGEQAFDSCEGLSQIVINRGVETIGKWAFEKCPSLIRLEIPGTVKMIPQAMCYGDSRLQKGVIGDGVQSVGPYAFEGCRMLTNVQFPSTVKPCVRNNHIFYNCNAQIKVTVGGKNACPQCLSRLGLFGCTNKNCNGK